MTPSRQEPALDGQPFTSSASLWKYLCATLALPNAVVNTVISMAIGLAFFHGYSEVEIFSGNQPLFPDIIISTFISILIMHIASIKLSSRAFMSMNAFLPPSKKGPLLFFGSGNSVLHLIRGGIVLALLWSLAAAITAYIVFTAFDIQSMTYEKVMTLKALKAFSIGYVQSVISGYANAWGRSLARVPEYGQGALP